MTNMTENFEKMHDLIGDTTSMSYEEYVEKMFKASIKINSKSEKVDLKELIDMKEVAEQLMIEKAINKSIEKATGRKFDGFSIKNGINFNEIDSLEYHIENPTGIKNEDNSQASSMSLIIVAHVEQQ